MLENNVCYYARADASEDSPCKEEKVEDFVFKLEKVVETSQTITNRLPSGSCLTMTLTAYPVGQSPDLT